MFLAGTKDLQVEEGASLIDIEGKFRFAISTKDIAAPMPESTDAGNGQWGRIEFGFITFSLQDLNKALDVDSDSAEKAGWSRSYVFKYKVTERGSVPGVVNDPETKTVRFKVTDDGKGKLTVVCLESPFTASTAFTFTNRCVVVPDNSANDEIGPGAGDKPLNSNDDADPNAGDVVSPSAGECSKWYFGWRIGFHDSEDGRCYVDVGGGACRGCRPDNGHCGACSREGA